IIAGTYGRTFTPALSTSEKERNGSRRGNKEDAERFQENPAPHVGGCSEKTSPQEFLQNLQNIFGPENLFVEIQRHHLRGEDRINKALVDLARQHRLPLLATNGVCYATPLQ